jgi:hypothetical protein
MTDSAIFVSSNNSGTLVDLYAMLLSFLSKGLPFQSSFHRIGILKAYEEY